MRKHQTEVVVIGGGATGTGIVRDLAMRGFKTILVEKRGLTHGTTGRFHGLLHSGGRYVVKDPQAAKECLQENMILRRIMPQCIEDTGGYFVVTPWDSPDYLSLFINGCNNVGIPLNEISIKSMLKAEPLLNPKISTCFQLPDASADSFLAAQLNAQSAREHGGDIFQYHEVVELIRAHDRVIGVTCHDLVKDEKVTILADIVVNASGAWVGKIARMIGVTIPIAMGKGTMIAINQRIVNTVINRCKQPSDGDILVPAHSVTVMGTTDIEISDPDHYPIEPWEIKLLMDEGEKLIPGFSDLRVLRAWAGIRPLYKDATAGQDRDISRTHILLDHTARDGVDGFISITGGKWTTFRLMAEVTVDKITEKLGVVRPCMTKLEAISDGKHAKYYSLGTHLSDIEKTGSYGNLICECELVTYQDVVHAITNGSINTINDIRRAVRLGMGPCQGGFCTFRIAGILNQLQRLPVQETNTAVCDFLQERWKGLLPILWGSQLKQERFNELIYLNVMDVPHLPGDKQTRLHADNYLSPTNGCKTSQKTFHKDSVRTNFETKTYQSHSDVIIIGSGLAGLTCGWRSILRGKETSIISFGKGATHWSTGCIDVLGYYYQLQTGPILPLRTAIYTLTESNKKHPYTICGLSNLEIALQEFISLSKNTSTPYSGSLDRNLLLPSAMGAIRPTCLAPDSMLAGDLSRRDPMLIVGFSNYFDFFPGYLVDNLNSQGYFAQDILLDLPILRRYRSISALMLARMFEEEDFRYEVIHALSSYLGNAARIGFPAVLGLNHPDIVMSNLQDELGIPVFEIPGLPPSIPGIRLYNMILQVYKKAGGRIYDGMEVISSDCNDKMVNTIWSQASSRMKPHSANAFVLATGGILGGGIKAGIDLIPEESIFHLPFGDMLDNSRPLNLDFIDPAGHPLYQMGVTVGPDFRPISNSDDVIYENLYTIGGILGGCDPVREFSLDGIALASGFIVGETV